MVDLILEKPGHWNAFEGYYAELFNGYNEEKLLELADYFDEEEIPGGYFGLDLWYEYDEIGKATDYLPNESKYSSGELAVGSIPIA